MKAKDFRKHVIEGLPGDNKIVLYHNMPDTFGLHIDGAVQNWAVRTDTYTFESFKKYVDSKNIGYKILTKKEYHKLK